MKHLLIITESVNLTNNAKGHRRQMADLTQK